MKAVLISSIATLFFMFGAAICGLVTFKLMSSGRSDVSPIPHAIWGGLALLASIITLILVLKAR